MPSVLSRWFTRFIVALACALGLLACSSDPSLAPGAESTDNLDTLPMRDAEPETTEPIEAPPTSTADDESTTTGSPNLDVALGSFPVFDLADVGRCLDTYAEDEGRTVDGLVSSSAFIVALTNCDPASVQDFLLSSYSELDVGERNIDQQALECTALEIFDFFLEIPFSDAETLLDAGTPPVEVIDRVAACGVSEADARFLLAA